MQSFFFIFLHIQKIAPQIAKKADNTTINPPPDRPPQRKYGSHRDTTHGGTSWTAHPGPGPAADPGLLILDRVRLLILDHSSRRSYFPCTGSGAMVDPGLLILSGGSLIQVDPSSDGPSIPGHRGPGQGHLIPLILSGGSWTVADGG